jgi:YVTN family beta-propeller protein
MLRKTTCLSALVLVGLACTWARFARGEALPARAAYVANYDDGTVSVVSLDTRQVVATIGVGQSPQAVAVVPNGSRVYVTNWQSNSVSVIDTTSGTVVATITDGVGTAPNGLAISRDGSRVYVANDQSATISVIDTATNTVVAQVSTPPHPYTLAFHPTRDELWVGYNTAGTVLEARSATDLSVLASLTSSNRAYASYGLVFRPDGSEAFGVEACGECGRFHRISGTLSGGSISVLQSDILAYNPPGAATCAAINPTSGVAYLGKYDSSSNSYASPKIFEFSAGAVARTLTFNGRDYSPQGMDVAPDDGLLYVAQGWNAQGFVSVIDPASLSTIATVNVGNAPCGIALCLRVPTNQDPVADAGPDQTVNTGPQATVTVTLDGTASSDPDGDALEYTWTVPEGSPVTLANVSTAVTTATVPATESGDYSILLSVTDGKGGASTDEVVIHVVVDSTPPEITCETDKVSLWPPDHRIVEVTLRVSISDGNVTAACSSSEPDDALGDGAYTGDVNGGDGFSAPQPVALTYDATQGCYVGTMRLRAERDGSDIGRTYSILCTATDAYGNTATTRCAVVVPHDRRKK